jgi:hypothetical protein
MPAFAYYKYFDIDNLADGASYSDSWVADENLVIHRIHIMDKAGAALTKSTFYLKVGPNVYTRAVVPAALLPKGADASPVLDISFPLGQSLEFTLKNLEGSAKSIMICFEVWRP